MLSDGGCVLLAFFELARGLLPLCRESRDGGREFSVELARLDAGLEWPADDARLRSAEAQRELGWEGWRELVRELVTEFAREAAVVDATDDAR